MKISLLLLLAVLFQTGCYHDQGRKKGIGVLEPELESDLYVVVSTNGISYSEERELFFEDFAVRLENNLPHSVYVRRVKEDLVSGYLLEKNPNAYSYQTKGETGHHSLSKRGLQGPGTIEEIPSGASISFLAPMPVLEQIKDGGIFRFSIFVYLDPEYNIGRWVQSGATTFQPNANQTSEATP